MKQHCKVMLTALALSLPIALAGNIVPETGAAPPINAKAHFETELPSIYLY